MPGMDRSGEARAAEGNVVGKNCKFQLSAFQLKEFAIGKAGKEKLVTKAAATILY